MKTEWIIATVLATVFVLLLCVHIYLLDGLDGILWSSAFGDDTLYASGYSDSSFRQIHTGMQK